MLQNLEDAKVLVGLGLTLSQAQVYLALAKKGRTTIKTLSAMVKMDRANVYRILERLQELNLVEKLLTSPTLYQPVNLEDALPMLLDQKQKECSEVRVKTKDLLRRYKNSQEDFGGEIEPQLILLPIGAPIMRKVHDMSVNVERTHQVLIHWSDFKDLIDDVVDRWESMLDRGVNVQVLVFLERAEVLPNQVTELSKNPLFKVKYLTSELKSTISICDEKEALISVSPRLSSRSASLWVNNPNLVALIREYFEMLWINALD